MINNGLEQMNEDRKNPTGIVPRTSAKKRSACANAQLQSLLGLQESSWVLTLNGPLISLISGRSGS